MSLVKPRTLLVAPSVIVLLLWMIVPLAMTLWFSFQRYNLLNPFLTGFAGLENYQFLIDDPALPTAMGNTLLLVGSVLIVTIVAGTLLAVLFDQPFAGRGVARDRHRQARREGGRGHRAGKGGGRTRHAGVVRQRCVPVGCAARRFVRRGDRRAAARSQSAARQGRARQGDFAGPHQEALHQAHPPEQESPCGGYDHGVEGAGGRISRARAAQRASDAGGVR